MASRDDALVALWAHWTCVLSLPRATLKNYGLSLALDLEVEWRGALGCLDANLPHPFQRATEAILNRKR